MDPATQATAEINREIVSQYFTGDYVGVLRAHHRWRAITERARYVVGAAGLLFVALTVQDLWAQKGTLAVWPMPDTVMVTPAGLGIILILAAAVPRLWSVGWELPAAVVLALTAIEIGFFNFGDRRIMILLMTLAMAGLLFGVYLRVSQRRRPLELAELEPRLDAWTNQLIARFIAGNRIPGRALSVADCRHVLRTFPKLERSGAPKVLGRIGSDGRARISPLGVGAFVFGAQTLTAIEGAIDLRTERVLYRRAHEFRLSDVVSIVWTSDTAEGVRGAEAPVNAARLPGMGGAGGSATERHRDTLEIRLSNGRAVSLTLRDTAFFPSGAARGDDAGGVEDPERIRALWHDLIGGDRSRA